MDDLPLNYVNQTTDVFHLVITSQSSTECDNEYEDLLDAIKKKENNKDY